MLVIMVTSTIVVVAVLLSAAACQESSPPNVVPPPDREVECDGYGGRCTELCCDPGYECQRGVCLNAALDLDFDGRAGYRDCDDYDRKTYPGAPEQCDERDNDCDGAIDEGVRNAAGECQPPCTDDDADGVTSCDEPEPDCDDTDAAVFPGAAEVCDGADNDCNGVSDEGFDEDGDGVGACGATGDCDDTNPAIAAGFVEVCDGLDNDCSGTADDGSLCGRLGQCVGGMCTWTFDAVGNEVEHDTGAPDGAGGWCAGADDLGNAVLIGAPGGGARDFPYGVYDATFRLKVADRNGSWGDCGVTLHLRANDRDEDGSGTCPDCYFGGDTVLVPAHFTTSNVYQDQPLAFSIGPERAGHLIEVVAVRGACETEVCVDSVTITTVR
jgi:hypothetical protein